MIGKELMGRTLELKNAKHDDKRLRNLQVNKIFSNVHDGGEYLGFVEILHCFEDSGYINMVYLFVYEFVVTNL